MKKISPQQTLGSIPCNIAILPSSTLEDRAIKMSADLHRRGSVINLDKNLGPFPHLTLYLVQLKLEDLEKVQRMLSVVAMDTPKVALTCKNYGGGEGYLYADYSRTDLINQLQERVVEVINPVRDGLRAKDKARLPTAKGKIRENIVKYGYRGVGDLFSPHITFARFTEEREVDRNDLPDPSWFSGQFIKLGLFEMGNNGTCARKIAEFAFPDC